MSMIIFVMNIVSFATVTLAIIFLNNNITYFKVIHTYTYINTHTTKSKQVKHELSVTKIGFLTDHSN